eukprot:superscaffoldBa00003800_g17713
MTPLDQVDQQYSDLDMNGKVNSAAERITHSKSANMVSDLSPEAQPYTRMSRTPRKAATFGKRSNSMRRNPKAEVTKEGWLYKQSDILIMGRAAREDLQLVRRINTLTTKSPATIEEMHPAVFTGRVHIITDNMIIAASTDLKHDEILHKASSGVKQWNKRWFVLTDRCLFYYKAHRMVRLGLLHMRNLQRWFAQLRLHLNQCHAKALTL